MINKSLVTLYSSGITDDVEMVIDLFREVQLHPALLPVVVATRVTLVSLIPIWRLLSLLLIHVPVLKVSVVLILRDVRDIYKTKLKSVFEIQVLQIVELLLSRKLVVEFSTMIIIKEGTVLRRILRSNGLARIVYAIVIHIVILSKEYF